MTKQEMKDKALDALYLLNQNGKGNKEKARQLLHELFINL